MCSPEAPLLWLPAGARPASNMAAHSAVACPLTPHGSRHPANFPSELLQLQRRREGRESEGATGGLDAWEGAELGQTLRIICIEGSI